MSKHTPGPWRSEQDPTKSYPCCTHIQILSAGTHIASIYDRTAADLIATAPEMIQMLELLARRYSHQFTETDRRDLMDLIVKANGGEL